jgi:hypothetical protein
MNLLLILAAGVLVLHLAFILWVILGAILTLNRPLLSDGVRRCRMPVQSRDLCQALLAEEASSSGNV